MHGHDTLKSKVLFHYEDVKHFSTLKYTGKTVMIYSGVVETFGELMKLMLAAIKAMKLEALFP